VESLDSGVYILKIEDLFSHQLVSTMVSIK